MAVSRDEFETDSGSLLQQEFLALAERFNKNLIRFWIKARKKPFLYTFLQKLRIAIKLYQ